MFSDSSVLELDTFAKQIGMKPAWRQDSHGFIHYDVTDPRRSVAISLGAKCIAYVVLSDYVYRLNPPGTPRRVTTFVMEGLACQRSATIASQRT